MMTVPAGVNGAPGLDAMHELAVGHGRKQAEHRTEMKG